MSPSRKRVVPSDLSVGEMARRAGVAVSTLHFYEAEGLIESWRTSANHRRFDRRQLRRVAVIRVAQTLGLSLSDIRKMLDKLPKDAALKKSDWADASEAWRADIDARIEMLLRLREQLDWCIGCGCLSLDTCPLYNAGDRLGASGPGPRRWTGDPGERADPPTSNSA